MVGVALIRHLFKFSTLLNAGGSIPPHEIAVYGYSHYVYRNLVARAVAIIICPVMGHSLASAGLFILPKIGEEFNNAISCNH